LNNVFQELVNLQGVSLTRAAL